MADVVISLTWGQVSLFVAGTGIALGAAGKWLVARTTKGLDSFVSEKAKNLATHQDIQKLVDQVRETERVKQEITDSIWDRNKCGGASRRTRTFG